ncbi:MAG: 23S rRNA (adenine(2503)-C(2))-methyltransferase RlmN [Deltaproteobacteria bacterium]|nr:23S rRNA (adenine(2503)-C(2))-methyltransferase RlmN [Deltaproteobacteria bacterium]
MTDASNTDARGRVDLRSLGRAAIRDLVEGMGREGYRALQTWKWMWQKGIRDFDEMTDISKAFRAELAERAWLPDLSVLALERASDGTRKVAWTLEDGCVVESVLIPEEDRLTLCVSSQVGCAQGCRFCVTGDLGFTRNLWPSEIALQALRARDLLDPGERVSNVVLMGMGEPLANLSNLLAALEILLDGHALGFSHRRVTVSTAGLVPALRELAARSPVNLAVSLNASTDAQRDAVMPINRRYPMAVLKRACQEIPIPRGKRISFEYVLIQGFNDSLDDADRLVAWLRGVKAKVNLIPYNENPGRALAQPDAERVKAFQDRVVRAGIQCSIRVSRGLEISAACGQLGLAELARRRGAEGRPSD